MNKEKVELFEEHLLIVQTLLDEYKKAATSENLRTLTQGMNGLELFWAGYQDPLHLRGTFFE